MNVTDITLSASARPSVVIITRNRARMLADCLAHLQQQTHPSFEIVVVDSSSNDETADLMRSWPTATYLRIPGGRNNMPQARNVGISHARGEIVAFIDDDSMVSPEWLGQIVSGFSDESIGGVGGRIFDRTFTGDPEEPRIGAILSEGRLIHNFDAEKVEAQDVDWLRGCNMAFRRAALAAAGGFDTRFTGDNSYEDVDHCVRVRRAGYRLRFIPAAEVTHLAGMRNPDVAPRDFECPERRLYQTRNGTYFYLKNFGWRWAFWRRSLRDVKGLTAYAVKNPSMGAWRRWGASLAGYPAGVLAWLDRRIP